MVNEILKEIAPEFGELMIDKYGNYFCQILLSNSTAE